MFLLMVKEVLRLRSALEIVCKGNLPSVSAALVLGSRAYHLAYCLAECRIACLAASDVVVGCNLEVVHEAEACAYVHAEL